MLGGMTRISKRAILSVLITGILLFPLLPTSLNRLTKGKIDLLNPVKTVKNLQVGTLMGRIFTWELLWIRFQKKPLQGYGMGSVSDFFLDPSSGIFYELAKYGDVYSTHNGYITLLVETGGVGFLLFMLALISLWIRLVHAFKNTGAKQIIFPGRLSLLFYLFIMGFSDTFGGYFCVTGIVWGLSACALTWEYLEKEGSDETIPL